MQKTKKRVYVIVPKGIDFIFFKIVIAKHKESKMADKDKKQKTPTAVKRLRNSIKSNLRNRARKNELKTVEKSFRAAVAAGEAEKAVALRSRCCSLMDKAVKAGTIHSNKASNKKSQFDKLMNTLAK